MAQVRIVKQQIVFLLIKKEHVVYQTVYALTCRQMNVLTKVANCSVQFCLSLS
jgi:hypothetical protein